MIFGALNPKSKEMRSVANGFSAWKAKKPRKGQHEKANPTSEAKERRSKSPGEHQMQAFELEKAMGWPCHSEKLFS